MVLKVLYLQDNMIKNLDQFIDGVLADFSPKQQKVLIGRFGLNTGKYATLQKIGDELGITRERVRQIEEQGIKKLRDKMQEQAKPLIQLAKDVLNNSGGIRRDDVFIEEVIKKAGFSGASKHTDAKLRFIFISAGVPMYSKENDDYHAFWFEDKKAEKKFYDFIKNTTQYLKENNRDEIFNNKTHLSLCTDPSMNDFLSIPKNFGVNVFGDFGLREWAEIEPKTIRDKAYLVLKKNKDPLHFEDIAKNIAKFGIDKKAAHVQTVHNELIKDGRFVLVGRGVYALKEYGYEPGTVREVIVKLLKKKGPLSAGDVVELVNEQRLLKKNTILLNLQNRRYFKRLNDGTYHIKEA